MVSQPSSPEVYQAGELHQLGAPVGIYRRRVTLSGKIALTGILLLAFFLAIDGFLLLVWQAVSSSIEAPLAFAQAIFAVGSLLSMRRHESLTTPLHARLSVSVYAEGLIYRKGRTTRVMRWEEIQSIRRQLKLSRRKKKIIQVFPTYICKIAQQPDLVLEAAIDDVAEVGVRIEHELVKRLLPQILADYHSDEGITFATLFLTQQYIENWRKKIAWTNVSNVEVDLENLVIESTGNELKRKITAPLANIPNVCVLEALLEHIQKEQGFVLLLTAKREIQDKDTERSEMPGKPRKRHLLRKTSWISTVLLTLLLIPGLALETWMVRDALNFQRLTALPSQTFQVSGTPTLIIKADAIDHLYMLNKDGDSNKVYVSGWKQTRGIGSLDDIQQHATQNGNTINLTWTMKQPPTILGVGEENVDLFIDLPTHSNVQIETRTGDLTIGYLQGEIKVKTQSGHIDIQAVLKGHSQLQSTSGQIDFCGTFAPQSSNLFQSESGKIDLMLVSNTAFSLAPSSSLDRLNNDFGSNEAGGVPRAHLDVTTHTGMITIYKGNPPSPNFYC